MKRIFLALALFAGVAPAWAQNYTRQATPDPGQYVPVFAIACQDAQGRSLPPGSPTCVATAAGGGSGSGAANAATTSNGTDGQATSATNQQNVVYNYLFNGSTWDRMRGTGGFLGVLLQAPLPAGTNVIGAVTQSGGPWTVSGTVGLNAGTNAIGSVSVSNFPATQPVSGTVTANLGTLNGAATAAGQTAQQGPVAPGAASASSVLGGVVYNSTAPAPTNGQQLALQADAAGNLKINNATLSPGAATLSGQTLTVTQTGTAAAGFSGLAGGIYNTTAPALSNGQQTGVQLDASGNLKTNTLLSTGGQAVGQSNPLNVQAMGYNYGSIPTVSGGFNTPAVDGRGQWKVSEAGSSDAFVGITPAVTQSGTALVAKGSAGNLYAYAATNLSTTAGFVAVVNATAAPASGASISPLECRPLAASGLADKSYNPGPPPTFSTGIVVLITTSCSTYTPGGATFIEAMVR